MSLIHPTGHGYALANHLQTFLKNAFNKPACTIGQRLVLLIPILAVALMEDQGGMAGRASGQPRGMRLCFLIAQVSLYITQNATQAIATVL
ncbi:unnamed protein product [Fusarium venenatum]|uniref:Uncharacterized protein n=1 Tax=Fusarium venenatum TaxID=56646 RepID=A0A2L2T2B4_9HYPO|nr:uncharacterized protein FVRRES_11960 [Fusarium venenatum]CEI39269.1 unnamed protein product [Fusarium venenatum]